MNISKQKIILSILGIINFAVCLILTIFTLPELIPTMIDAHEKIVCLGTKWLMLIASIIPSVFVCLALALTKKQSLSTCFKWLFYLSLYENMLLFICFSLSPNLNISSTIEVPVSPYVFIPASFFIMVYGLRLKHTPFNALGGIRTKATKCTEFIWKQSHIFAKNVFFCIGFLLLVVSIVLSFFHLWFIPLALILFGLISAYLIVMCYANSLYKKYNEMKQRQEAHSKYKESSQDTNKHTAEDNNKK